MTCAVLMLLDSTTLLGQTIKHESLWRIKKNEMSPTKLFRVVKPNRGSAKLVVPTMAKAGTFLVLSIKNSPLPCMVLIIYNY